MKNSIKPSQKKLVLLFICFVSVLHINAQKKVHPHNENYFETFPKTVTARIYVSKKYAPFTFGTPTNARDLEYRPVTKLNLGIGATYNNYTLNVAFGFGFLNKNNVDKGKTKGLDLHFHLFPNKLTVDLLGIFHKGYYINPKGYGSINNNDYYIRPDAKITLLGIAAYRVPNAEKFSYKAAIVQNEWQKKSAGSLLYGGQAYYVSFDADSALVPKSIQSNYPQAGINKVSFISIGPGAGYAYTLVIQKHFFATASLIGNLDLTFTTEESSSKNKKFSLKPSAVYKGAIGYNSSTWSLVADITGNYLSARGASSPKDYVSPTGNYRITLAKKFKTR